MLSLHINRLQSLLVSFVSSLGHIPFLQGISQLIRRHQTCSKGKSPAAFCFRCFLATIWKMSWQPYHNSHMPRSRQLASHRGVLEIMWHVSSYMFQSSCCHLAAFSPQVMICGRWCRQRGGGWLFIGWYEAIYSAFVLDTHICTGMIIAAIIHNHSN